MPGQLIASDTDVGTGVSVVTISVSPVAAGQLIAAIASCASVSKTFTASDNSGVGNAYQLLQLSNPTVGQSAVLALAVAAGDMPSGVTFTFPISSGSPGGRMASVAKFDDTLRSPFAIDISAAAIGSPAAVSFTQQNTPTTSPELIIFGCTMVSSNGGGVLDGIQLDNTLTQLDNRNHPNSATRYSALGYKYILNANPVSDTVTFQAPDLANLGMVSVKLPIPPSPGGPTEGEKLILKLTG